MNRNQMKLLSKFAGTIEWAVKKLSKEERLEVWELFKACIESRQEVEDQK